jgi:hypothetical protein
MQIRRLTLSLLLALAACAAPPPPPVPQPAPTPKPIVVAPVQLQRPVAEWVDWPLAQGDWVYRRDERGSVGLFGVAGQNATVTLRCDIQRRRIYLGREGAGPGGKMVVRSSSSMKEFAASPTGAIPAYQASEIMPNDPILDAMAFSRGRIALEVDGQQPIAIPSWAEITRIVEDCRV